MKNKWDFNKYRRVTLFGVIMVVFLFVSGVAIKSSNAAISEIPSSAEVGKYLVIGMRQGGSDAFLNSSSNEYGANRSFLSGADPNTHSVFASRWNGYAPGTVGPQPSDEEPGGGQPDGVPPGAAPVFQGIDWTGNIALTNSGGTFELQNIQVFSDLGIQAQNNSPVQSVSNSDYFPGNENTSNSNTTAGNEAGGDLDDPGAPGTDSGIHSNDGLEGSVDLALLRTDLGKWRSFIQELPEDPSCEITSNISGLNTLNIDTCDDNGDGIAVIDIERGGSDFELNNADWILQGSGDILAIFRIRRGANMNMSNTSILLGDGGIGGGSDTIAPRHLGAIFVKAHPGEEGTGSSDTVFSANNVVFNGIGFWDLVDINNEYSGADTGLTVSNGQGCAQFISNIVNHSNTRWVRCANGESTLLYDFGDAPNFDTQTNLADGAHHKLVSPLVLGSCVDAEFDGQAVPADDWPVLDDGTSGVDSPFAGCNGADDEDGFDGIIDSTWTDGEISLGATVSGIPSGQNACVHVWIDWDSDGFGMGTYESFAKRTYSFSENGVSQTIVFDSGIPPSGSFPEDEDIYVRFRVIPGACDPARAIDLGPTEAVVGGEVEDHIIVGGSVTAVGLNKLGGNLTISNLIWIMGATLLLLSVAVLGLRRRNNF